MIRPVLYCVYLWDGEDQIREKSHRILGAQKGQGL